MGRQVGPPGGCLTGLPAAGHPYIHTRTRCLGPGQHPELGSAKGSGGLAVDRGRDGCRRKGAWAQAYGGRTGSGVGCSPLLPTELAFTERALAGHLSKALLHSM